MQGPGALVVDQEAHHGVGIAVDDALEELLAVLVGGQRVLGPASDVVEHDGELRVLLAEELAVVGHDDDERVVVSAEHAEDAGHGHHHPLNLKFIVNQSIWREGETPFSDIILPACTVFEKWDIGETFNCGPGYVHHFYTMNNHRIVTMQHKCIEPLGESKSDYQIFQELANRLGLELAEKAILLNPEEMAGNSNVPDAQGQKIVDLAKQNLENL